MDERDDDLMLSGLQHFAYCRRQWALIHIEQQWAENERTVDGMLFHKHAHDADAVEKRGDIIITRGLRIRSNRLRVSGICDVVEFHKDSHGITLPDYEGNWQPYPIEYKKGKPKENQADELQLCGQAICLEEMLLCEIPSGSLFYGETRRRVPVEFTKELRLRVEDMLKEMHELCLRGYTPKVKMHKGCNACSLKDICLPKLGKTKSVTDYIACHLSEDAK
jgi:CRISPR-associated exonuclease Cas4